MQGRNGPGTGERGPAPNQIPLIKHEATGSNALSLGSEEDMPLVRVVGKLFDKSKKELQNDLDAVRQVCSEKSALDDLKVFSDPLSLFFAAVLTYVFRLA